MSPITRLVEYIKSSRLELKKVVWPSRKEVIEHTALVIGVSLGLAAFLGLVDYVLTLVIQIIFKR